MSLFYFTLIVVSLTVDIYGYDGWVNIQLVSDTNKYVAVSDDKKNVKIREKKNKGRERWNVNDNNNDGYYKFATRADDLLCACRNDDNYSKCKDCNHIGEEKTKATYMSGRDPSVDLWKHTPDGDEDWFFHKIGNDQYEIRNKKDLQFLYAKETDVKTAANPGINLRRFYLLDNNGNRVQTADFDTFFAAGYQQGSFDNFVHQHKDNNPFVYTYGAYLCGIFAIICIMSVYICWITKKIMKMNEYKL